MEVILSNLKIKERKNKLSVLSIIERRRLDEVDEKIVS